MTPLGFRTNLSREGAKWSATTFGGKKRSPRVLLARCAERPGSEQLTRERAVDAFMGSCRDVGDEDKEGSSEVGGDRVERGESLGESMRLHRGIKRQDEFGLLVTHSCSRCRASSVLSKNRESLRVVWDEICLW
jgi:hypothetical protein